MSLVEIKCRRLCVCVFFFFTLFPVPETHLSPCIHPLVIKLHIRGCYLYLSFPSLHVLVRPVCRPDVRVCFDRLEMVVVCMSRVMNLKKKNVMIIY